MVNKKFFLLLLTSGTFLFGANGGELAKKLNLNPSEKAVKQWDRVFTSSDKMKELKIDTLSDNDKNTLKKYLQDHAADSDKPTVAGK